jgi:hypothetical protein
MRRCHWRACGTPPIARAPAQVGPGHREPTFDLAENTITLRDVDVDKQLPSEVIEVIQLGVGPLDLEASTNDDWLQATVSTAAVVLVLRPPARTEPGHSHHPRPSLRHGSAPSRQSGRTATIGARAC